MRRRDHVKKEENVSYWQSYSDMMAALLLIFVLVIAVAIVALNDYKEKLAEQNEELLARQDLLEKQADEYLKLKFGTGVVTAIVEGGRDYEVTVNFDKVGVKKMFASFAKLKKV